MKDIPRDWSWIGDWAGRRATLTPNKEAFFDNTTDKLYTYAEMETRANQLARVLQEYDIKKGDRVATYAKNRFEMIDLFLATGKIGAILVPFNVRLAPREVEYLRRKTEPSLTVYDSDIGQSFEEVRPDHNVLAMGEPVNDDDQDINELMTEESAEPVERPTLVFDDPHMIVFTGGTTGLPKGAILSHRLIFWNSVNTCMSWGLRPDDVQPLLFPLFHTGGWNVLLVPCYHLGAKTILMGDFDPKETLRVIEDEKCTIVIGVPTMFQMMAQHEKFKKTDFSSVRVFISGGAPCPVAIMENYWEKGKPFKMGYGLTEVGPNNFYLPISDIKKKPNSVGYPVLHCDMKIANEDGEEVPQGDVGELLLKGPHIFSGYWDEPKETKKTIDPDGWVHTGDL
ncbi:MAG: AMP-binding protein, partial [Promethearchaeati archaeon]